MMQSSVVVLTLFVSATLHAWHLIGALNPDSVQADMITWTTRKFEYLRSVSSSEYDVAFPHAKPTVTTSRSSISSRRRSTRIQSELTGSIDSIPNVARLTIRPHTMAIGKQTTVAGLAELTGFPGYFVYVPKSCVGKTRMPLAVLLHGGGRSGAVEIEKFQSLADKYRMIVLAGNAAEPGQWDIIIGMRSKTAQSTRTRSGVRVSSFAEHDVRRIDSALKTVLRTHAIDPNRLALLGFSDGGSYSLFLGRNNLDVFSRVAALSAFIPFDGVGPVNPNTQFFLSGGVAEGEMVSQTLRLAKVLREQGHAVITQLGLRGHVDELSDEDHVWAWLQQSWVNPTITAKGAAVAAVSPGGTTVLTEENLRQLTSFWTSVQRAPDSVQTVGRAAHQKQLMLSLGTEWTTLVVTDIPAMATKFPFIANALKNAGLTAAQADAYRAAILSIDLAQRGRMALAGGKDRFGQGRDTTFVAIDSSSTLGKNLQLIAKSNWYYNELKQTGILLDP